MNCKLQVRPIGDTTMMIIRHWLSLFLCIWNVKVDIFNCQEGRRICESAHGTFRLLKFRKVGPNTK